MVGIVVTSYSVNVQSPGMMMKIDSNEKQGLSVDKAAKILSMRPANQHSGYAGQIMCQVLQT